MKKIAFIIDDKNLYHAGIKTLVDLGYGLYKLGINPIFYSLNMNKDLLNKLHNNFQHLKFVNVNNLEGLIKNIKNSDIGFLITADILPTQKWHISKILYEIKNKININIIIYPLAFYGLNTIGTKNKKNLIQLSAHFIPWNALTNKYSNMLNSLDFVIGMSYSAGYFLNIFYSVYTSGVVYPPVGVNFEKIEKPEINKKEGLLVYLGHYPDYYLRDIPYTINQLSKRISKIKIWTENPENLNGLKPNIEVYTDISDKEVMNLYQSSEAIYIPTAFEGFGYVGPEALLFDTPVILDTYQPWLEGFPMDSNAVKILDPKDKSIEPFLEFLKSGKDIVAARQYIERRYSAIQSAKDLLYIINNK